MSTRNIMIAAGAAAVLLLSACGNDESGRAVAASASNTSAASIGSTSAPSSQSSASESSSSATSSSATSSSGTSSSPSSESPSSSSTKSSSSSNDEPDNGGELDEDSYLWFDTFCTGVSSYSDMVLENDSFEPDTSSVEAFQTSVVNLFDGFGSSLTDLSLNLYELSPPAIEDGQTVHETAVTAFGDAGYLIYDAANTLYEAVPADEAELQTLVEDAQFAFNEASNQLVADISEVDTIIAGLDSETAAAISAIPSCEGIY